MEGRALARRYDRQEVDFKVEHTAVSANVLSEPQTLLEIRQADLLSFSLQTSFFLSWTF